MDRNTITGLILIFLIFLGWMYWSMPSAKQQAQQKKAAQDSVAATKADSGATTAHQLAKRDTVNAKTVQAKSTKDTTASSTTKEKAPPARQKTVTRQKTIPANGLFAGAGVQERSTVTIKTPLYHTTFTNAGAGPISFTLQKYQTWKEEPVQLIVDSTSRSVYKIGFMTTGNRNINTKKFLFKQLTPTGDTLTVRKGETKQIKYALKVGNNQRIVYTYTFHGNSYEIGLDVTFHRLRDNIVGHTFDLGWVSALNLTEKNKKSDAAEKAAYVYSGGEKEMLKLSSPGHKKKVYSGDIEWVSTRTKWFTQIIKPTTPTVSARLIADISQMGTPVNTHHYQTFLKMRIPESNTVSFQMYLGPLAYNQLKNYAETAFSMVQIGWSFLHWFARPLVELIIIPFFTFLGNYMGMGLAVILFAIGIKLVLWPLTHKSFRSMAKTREMQPKMNAIKEKYKDDKEKQQKEIMKLYKEGDFNPLGSCLPMLLQMPILYTLFFYIRNSILLRGESFLWANDLSVHDVILQLPFHIPFFGDYVSGFALLMALAMVAQFKFTGGMGGAGGSGKVMQFIFPLIMFFFFNHLPAALCLYYLFYTIVNVIQQWIIYEDMESKKDDEAVAATA